MQKVVQRKRKEPNPVDEAHPDAFEVLGDDFTLPRTHSKRIKALWESAELLLSESESVSESNSSRSELSFSNTGSWKHFLSCSFEISSSDQSTGFDLSNKKALFLSFALMWSAKSNVARFLLFSLCFSHLSQLLLGTFRYGSLGSLAIFFLLSSKFYIVTPGCAASNFSAWRPFSSALSPNLCLLFLPRRHVERVSY